MAEFDRGPSAAFAGLFDRVPDPAVPADFWFDWGPVFYRGRLDGSARAACRVRSWPDRADRRAQPGAEFAESDYEAIPRRDLPFGAPAFLGDDAWVRARPGGAQNSVSRPSPDDGHTLTWRAPQ